MSIRLHTVARVYCDGAVHQGLEITSGSETPMAEIKARVRAAGWTVTRDGRTLCPAHKEAKR